MLSDASPFKPGRCSWIGRRVHCAISPMTVSAVGNKSPALSVGRSKLTRRNRAAEHGTTCVPGGAWGVGNRSSDDHPCTRNRELIQASSVFYIEGMTLRLLLIAVGAVKGTTAYAPRCNDCQVRTRSLRVAPAEMPAATLTAATPQRMEAWQRSSRNFRVTHDTYILGTNG